MCVDAKRPKRSRRTPGLVRQRPEQEILDLDAPPAAGASVASGRLEQRSEIADVRLAPEDPRARRRSLYMHSRSLERRTGHLQLSGGIEIAGAEHSKEDVLAPQFVRTQRGGFLARVLQDAPNLRRGHERRLTDLDVSKAPMGGLAGDPEIACDGCERGALRQRVRDLAALEAIELPMELAEEAESCTGGWGACGFSREARESLTAGQASPTRPATVEML